MNSSVCRFEDDAQRDTRKSISINNPSTILAIFDFFPLSQVSSAQNPSDDFDVDADASGPPREDPPQSDMEILADRLFSVDHLKLILRDPQLFGQFQSFLTSYRPLLALSLRRYLDVQKALAAVKYANMLAENLWPGLEATVVNDSFESRLGSTFDDLVNVALPGFITYRSTELVTDVLVKEITGQSTPCMQEMLHGLAEVYCLTDENVHDSPIIYASEEFYKTTQYDPAYVIGRNCRFLTGLKTSGASIVRICEALSEGRELCETVVNHRRDGTPFINLLLIAPLYDSNNKLCHFLGAQVDISGLLQGGRGIESFDRLLAQDRSTALSGDPGSQTSMTAIAELGSLLNENERKIIETCGQTSNSSTHDKLCEGSPAERKSIGMYSSEAIPLWPPAKLGPNGRLPGVFQDYIMVTPYPTLRITFASPALRGAALLRSSFLNRIRGPRHVRQSIQSALCYGNSFTAKISWLPDAVSPTADANWSMEPSPPAEPQHIISQPSNSSARRKGELRSKVRWIHCTPLVGHERRVGIWMVVMVKADSFTESFAQWSFQQK